MGTQVRRNPVQRTPAEDVRSDAETRGDADRRNEVERRSDAESFVDDEAEAKARTSDDDESMDVEIIEEPEEGGTDTEELAPLFAAGNAADYRARWDVVQRGFVDDPARAVRDGDALLSEVINALARTFADERTALERELSLKNEASTETLRRALQRHRAFFERLLSF